MEPQDKGVTITDIQIPFWRLVAIFIKFVLAAIPAYLVVVLIIVVIASIFGMLFGGLGLMLQEMWRV
jgi:hypothetical protein